MNQTKWSSRARSDDILSLVHLTTKALPEARGSFLLCRQTRAVHQVTRIKHEQDPMKCKICNEEMIQKDRWRIGIVGVLLVASMMAAFFVPYFWVLGIFLVMIGCYLIV